MDITVNNVVATANTDTVSYTPSSVTDPLLVVIASDEDSGSITGVNADAVAMTQDITSQQVQNVAGIYSILNPGTSAIDIALQGSPTDRGFTIMTLGGVDQTTPLDATAAHQQTNSSTISGAITTINNNSIIISGISCGAFGTHTPDSGQIEQSDDDHTGGGSGASWATSTELKATAGSDTQGWTHSASQSRTAMALASYKPAAGAPAAAPPQLALIGVG